MDNFSKKPDPYTLINELQKKVFELEKIIKESRFSGQDRYMRPQIIAKNGSFQIEEKDSNSTNAKTGMLEVVGGKLYIYDGSSWTVVGTQS